MKKNFLFIAVAILIGLFLTVTQVIAAAPGISMSKKTPPPGNPSSQPVTGVDKPRHENNGNGKPENPGKPADSGKPEVPGKSANAGNPEKKAKPVHLRGEIIGISEDKEAGTFIVTIQLVNGGEFPVVASNATVISVPTLKKTSQGAILNVGMQVIVKAHEDAEMIFQADTIHVIPAAPLHIHHSGKVVAYTNNGIDDGSITIANGNKETTFKIINDITDPDAVKTTILPPNTSIDAITLGDRVTIISITLSEPGNDDPGPGDGGTALAIVVLPKK